MQYTQNVRIFFFFQAEDGIRDGHVTGVQTCALPISLHGEFRRGLQVNRGVAAAGTDRINIGIDRKSTRLNSSHVAISYAVFCLKKKKKNNAQQTYEMNTCKQALSNASTGRAGRRRGR